MNVSMVSSVCLAVVCATTGGVVSASELSLDYFKGTALRDADMKGIPEKIDSILARAPEEFAFARGVAAFGALGGCRTIGGTPTEYSISILGDTHFDASPASVYHGKWVPRTPNDRRDRPGEFRRNAEMWAGRLPRLIAAAAKTRRGDTAFLFQMGDLIQGDCTDYETHLRMFRDAQAACSKGFGDLPFLTVCGNHDIRGGGDKAFDGYILPLASKALGFPVESANFMFRHGPDAYVFVDFMRPDVRRINRMLDETEDARYLFFVLHSPIAASDTWGPYWFLLGKPEDTDARRKLFARLLGRRAIVLCGHLHVTQIRRWRRDGGELVEFCANSVWRPQEDRPSVLASTPAEYGDYAKAHPTPMDEDHDGCRQKRTQAEILALQGEYRAGLVEYRKYRAAGHYLLRVSDRGVAVDFYACDALTPTETFVLRGNSKTVDATSSSRRKRWETSLF